MSFNNSKPSIGMVLAAGLGKRFQPLTLTTPKPLIKVNGKCLVDHAISHLYDLGIRKIIINTHYLANRIHEHLEKYKSTDIEIIISHEPELLETGGGILNSMKNIAEEPFIIINSDIFLEKKDDNPILSDLINMWDQDKMEALLLLKDHNDIDYHPNGDFTLHESGKIIRSSTQENNFVFSGAYILQPSFFKGYEVHRFSVSEILFKSNDKGFNNYSFYGLKLKAKWFDIGTPERLNSLEEYLKS